MMMRKWWWVWLLLLAPLAQAATVHAFLDRSHVTLGDTVTLNIQTGAALGNPDLSALQKDFDVLGTSRSRNVRIANGNSTRTVQLGIALRPLHAGTLTIPSLEIGGTKTRPLTLQVAAAPAGGTGKVGGPVFMEASVRSSSPWVGQQTVYTLRLFYLPGVDGSLGNPTAAGARLIPLQRDHRYTASRDGYSYKVIERSWALIPQRSGMITVTAPVFQGQRVGPGNPNVWFNNPNALLNNPNALFNRHIPGFGTPVRVVGPSTQVDARAVPASAGKPWLPARGVQLKLTGLPADGKVDGSAPLTVTLSISARGQPADTLPKPQLPAIAGTRVYPDQTQDTTDDSGQWLEGTRTRSFAIVPQHDGKLTIPAITLNWWDVTRDRAQQAMVPAHTLRVSGVAAHAAGGGAAPVSSAVASSSVASPAAVDTAVTASASPVASPTGAVSGPVLPWRALAIASLALWVVVVVAAWWWLRGRRQSDVAERGRTAASGGLAPETGDRPHDGVVAAPPRPRVLQKQAVGAARDGDAPACERALLAWARALRADITHLGALADALDDQAQRDALDALQRARWREGDVTPACRSVAEAFARGFVWRGGDQPARADEDVLPPLYPS